MTRLVRSVGYPLVACLMLVTSDTVSAENESPPSEKTIAAAIDDLWKGRYEEAIEKVEPLLEQSSDDAGHQALITFVRAQVEQGNWEKAEERLAAAADQHPDDSSIQSHLAELHFNRGRYEAAGKAAERALTKNPDDLRAQLVRARLQLERGQIEGAVDAFREFVRYYNKTQPKDAETLLLIAEGAVEYARAKSVSQIFNFVVNDLTPDALKADPARWDSHLIAGSLLLEKYNQGQAVQELNKALAINPHAAPVLAALGRAALSEREYDKAADFLQRALKFNHRELTTLLLAVDIAFAGDDVKAARQFADRAHELNPASQAVLGRIAACDLLEQGIPDAGLSEDFLKTGHAEGDLENRQFASAFRELLTRNPAPGEFLTTLGEFLEQQHRWDLAARCYLRAIEVAPQLSSPKTSLGLLKMRTGDLEEARIILDAAFKADPFHVRVSNMRKVLGVLEGYETISTEHFVVRFDKVDRLQARYISDYLEEIYPALTKEFGYEPPTRVPFELYSSAKNQSAHAWFSTRMIGLPWIQTIGASTGMIVALASPTASQQPYDWARVVKHEFSHILSLQETGFAIPHWYTEALAVRTEASAFPDDWRRILNQRLRNDELFTLENLNQGFQKPRNGDDWQCAYCLSRLYARFMEENHGSKSLFDLVAAYRRGLKTPEAIQEVFQTDVPTFEKKFRTFLEGVIKELNVGRVTDAIDLEEAQAAFDKDPNRPQAEASLAWALLNSGQLANAKKAKQHAEHVLETEAGNPLANAVMSRMDLRLRKEESAIARLEKAFETDPTHPAVVGLLGRLYLDDKQYEKAAAVFESGLKAYPKERGWIRGLAIAYVKLDRAEPLPALMEAIAMFDGDDVTCREWLQAHAVAEERWADAEKWGVQALHIRVKNPDTLRRLGQAYLKTDRPDQARRALQDALDLDPNDAEAKTLLESLSSH